MAETQAGKSALPWAHPCNVGAIGVTGTESANTLARTADLILAVGTRLQDFTTGSWSLFENPDMRLLTVNAAAFDATKHDAVAVVADARTALEELDAMVRERGEPMDRDVTLPRDGTVGRPRDVTGNPSCDHVVDRPSDHAVNEPRAALKADWDRAADAATRASGDDAALSDAGVEPTSSTSGRGAAGDDAPPSDAQVIGAVQRTMADNGMVVCAAGGLPGELHKLWRSPRRGDYHLEYGYSCMGYEIAGGLGVKLARPDADVVVVVGDGSYMMMNSELATSVMLGLKLTVVVLDNRGFGCINRLQRSPPGAPASTTCSTPPGTETPSAIDFAAHAASMGAVATHVDGIERPRSRAHRSAFGRADFRHRHRHRPARQHPGRRPLVGRGGARRCRTGPEVAAARESYDAALRKRS